MATFLNSIHFGHESVAAVVAKNRWEFPVILNGVLAVGGTISGASYAFTDCKFF